MAQMSSINFELDQNVKKSMEQACLDIGLSIEAAFTIFAKKVAREKRLPFKISAPFHKSGKDILYLKEKIKDFNKSRRAVKFIEHESL